MKHSKRILTGALVAVAAAGAVASVDLVVPVRVGEQVEHDRSGRADLSGHPDAGVGHSLSKAAGALRTGMLTRRRLDWPSGAAAR